MIRGKIRGDKMKQIKTFALLSVCLAGMLVALTGCGEVSDDQPPEEKLPEPIYAVDETLGGGKDANDDAYSVKNVVRREESPLAGKTVYWLGSSVTFGSAAKEESMADYLAALTGCVSKKEAVSGTTIYDDGGTGDSGARSYTRRLKNSTVFDRTEQVDAFICQISTNDARSNRLSKWGSVTDDIVTNKEVFNRGTTLGGVEYIIAYAIETWDCPVYFYSGSYFGDDGVRKGTNPKGSDYKRLVDEVKKVCEKWTELGYEVGVIDLYGDETFNSKVTDSYYQWCMSDAIHPKRAGYLQWWTPYIENRLAVDLA